MRIYRQTAAPLLLMSLLLAGCSVQSPRSAPAPPAVPTISGQVIYIVRRQWHIAVEFPADDLAPPLASLKSNFPEAKYFSFGFGDLHYLVAKNKNFPGIFAALWPGRGLILINGGTLSPEEIFGTDQVIPVAVSSAQGRAAQAFVWESLSSNAGKLVPYAEARPDEGLYFSAVPSYSAFYTCNTWVADILAAAGLPIGTHGVIFADQLWSQVRRLPRSAQPLTYTVH
jgi:hypothetical protein